MALVLVSLQCPECLHRGSVEMTAEEAEGSRVPRPWTCPECLSRLVWGEEGWREGKGTGMPSPVISKGAPRGVQGRPRYTVNVQREQIRGIGWRIPTVCPVCQREGVKIGEKFVHQTFTAAEECEEVARRARVAQGEIAQRDKEARERFAKFRFAQALEELMVGERHAAALGGDGGEQWAKVCEDQRENGRQIPGGRKRAKGKPKGTGERVEHPVFGGGELLASEEVGDGKVKVVVRFDDGMVRTVVCEVESE